LDEWPMTFSILLREVRIKIVPNLWFHLYSSGHENMEKDDELECPSCNVSRDQVINLIHRRQNAPKLPLDPTT
jgi:hypothetical protein